MSSGERRRERGRRAGDTISPGTAARRHGEAGMIKPTVIYRKVCRPPSRSLGILVLLFCMGVISETCDPPPQHPAHVQTHTRCRSNLPAFILPYLCKNLLGFSRLKREQAFFSLTSRVGVWLPSRFLSNSNLTGLRPHSRGRRETRAGATSPRVQPMATKGCRPPGPAFLPTLDVSRAANAVF